MIPARRCLRTGWGAMKRAWSSGAQRRSWIMARSKRASWTFARVVTAFLTRLYSAFAAFACSELSLLLGVGRVLSALPAGWPSASRMRAASLPSGVT